MVGGVLSLIHGERLPVLSIPLLKSTTIVYMPEGTTIAVLSPASRQAISGPAMATAASRLSRYTGKAYRSKQAIGASQCTLTIAHTRSRPGLVVDSIRFQETVSNPYHSRTVCRAIP